MKKLIKTLIIFFSLSSFSIANESDLLMEKYMVNCVNDFYLNSKLEKKELNLNDKAILNDSVYECALKHNNFRPLFYYYKGKIFTKPKR